MSPERVQKILAGLAEMYPNAKCALHHSNAWELLVATILSAQCTDVRVNMVTPELFKKYPTPADFAALKPEALEPEIRSTGFFRNKSKSIVGAAQKIVNEFGGKVPNELEKLITVPGAARKTANVVLGSWFGKAEGVVVDTHVHRISRRLELTTHDDARNIEQDLMRVIPRDQWIDFAHRIIWHGRALCIARRDGDDLLGTRAPPPHDRRLGRGLRCALPALAHGEIGDRHGALRGCRGTTRWGCRSAVHKPCLVVGCGVVPAVDEPVSRPRDRAVRTQAEREVPDPADPKGDFWALLPQEGAPRSRVPSDRESMEAQVERAEARLIDHCLNIGRWLDSRVDDRDATGRLNETLAPDTIAMLRRGLGAHPDALRGLRRFPGLS